MLRRAVVPCLAVTALAAPLFAGTIKVPQQFPTIQEAVDTAVAGDTVLVAKGTYHEHVVVSTPEVTLRGKGAIIDGDYTGACVDLQGTGITLDGFTLVEGGISALADDPLNVGINAEGDDNVVRRCSVRHSSGVGIRFIGTGTIEQCTIVGCLDDGIIVNTGNGIASVPTFVLKNTVRHCGGDGFNGLFGPFELEKNVFEDNLGAGLLFTVGIIVPDGESTLTKNRCTGNEGAGIEVSIVDTVTSATLTGNVCEGNELGMRLTGPVAVVGNTVQGSRREGVQLFTPNLLFEGNKVLDNGTAGVFVNAEAGIAPLQLTGNTISGNAGDGLRVSAGLVTISGNLLRDNLGDGLQLDAGAPAGCEVLDNKLLANGHDGLDNRGAGTLIRGNVCKGNGGADLGAVGTGAGVVTAGSEKNVTGDGTDLQSEQEAELETIE